LGEVKVAIIDGFELAAVDGDDRLGEEVEVAAKNYKLGLFQTVWSTAQSAIDPSPDQPAQTLLEHHSNQGRQIHHPDVDKLLLNPRQETQKARLLSRLVTINSGTSLLRSNMR
jgi:hypothetical protein